MPRGRCDRRGRRRGHRRGHCEHFVVDPYQAGAGTSHNMNVNEVLANRANEIVGAPGCSMTPCIPTTTSTWRRAPTTPSRPTSGWRCCRACPAARRLRTTARRDGGARATPSIDIVKAGRTHLQDAMPIRLGQEFTAYAGSIDRGLRASRKAADYLNDLGIGGSAVGTGVTVETAYPAADGHGTSKAITGLHAARRGRPHPAHAEHGRRGGVRRRCCVLAVDLSKIASDLRLMVMGPRTGPRRDLPPGRPAGLLHHARQDQSVDSGDGQPGLLPGDRLRHHRRHRGGTWAAGAQRDDAGDRAQRPALDADHDERRDDRSARSACGASTAHREPCARIGWSVPRRWRPRSRRRSATPPRPS
jgi:hypothetical protein